MKPRRYLVLGLLPWLLPALPGHAQEPAAEAKSADEIVAAANLAAFYPGADGRAEARMLIVDDQGRSQTRQFTLLRRDREDGGDQDLLVLFSRPSDVRGTVYRVARHVKGDDDRWIYLPGLDLVKRIAAGDKRTSFVGSHFFYEDVSGRNLREDNFRRLDDEDGHYRIEGVAKDPATVEFSRYQAWIHQGSLLPVRVDYFDHQDRAYRRVEALKVETIEGHSSVLESRVSDLRYGGHTLLQFRGIDYDLGLPADLFSERSLRNPPRQWLR